MIDSAQRCAVGIHETKSVHCMHMGKPPTNLNLHLKTRKTQHWKASYCCSCGWCSAAAAAASVLATPCPATPWPLTASRYRCSTAPLRVSALCWCSGAHSYVCAAPPRAKNSSTYEGLGQPSHCQRASEVDWPCPAQFYVLRIRV